MSKYLIGFVVVFLAVSLALLAAFGISAMLNRRAAPPVNGFPGQGMMNGGIMGYQNQPLNGKRLTMDEAVSRAQTYIASINGNLSVAEVMSFQNNFYVAVKEKDTGRAAFELLMDPVTGSFASEPGPNMMWNQKYGMMGSLRKSTAENPVTLDQSAQIAQKALDSGIPGATLETDGFNFYGYYTFDYKINGAIAGMLSVNGFTGQVWFHTWHGTFIEENVVAQ
jgi:hypothetical protein